LRQHARGGDLVLLKAARKYKFEELLAELRGVHAG
jgi:UDP-N-acetylmuramyl pentapeptide synthase